MAQDRHLITLWYPRAPLPNDGATQYRTFEACGCVSAVVGKSKFLGLCPMHANTVYAGFAVDMTSPPLEFSGENGVKIRRGVHFVFGDDDTPYVMVDGNQPNPFNPKGNLVWYDQKPDGKTLEKLWVNAWLKRMWEAGPTVEAIAQILTAAHDPAAVECERIACVLLDKPTPVEQAAINLFTREGKKKGSGAFGRLCRAVQQFLDTNVFASYHEPPRMR